MSGIEELKILPDFGKINLDELEREIEDLISENFTVINEITKSTGDISWNSHILPLQDIEDKVTISWSVLSHLNNVASSDKVREIYTRLLPKIINLSTKIAHNRDLFNIYEKLYKEKDKADLDRAKVRVLEKAIKSFKLAGVHLNAKDKESYAKIEEELSSLSNKFSQNVLDATKETFIHLESKELLAGMHDKDISLAAEAAKKNDLDGYVLTIDGACYVSVMKKLDDESIRARMHKAYTTRASELDCNAKYDNSDLIKKIMHLRVELIKLLGFDNYAQYSLERKMATTTDEVLNFLQEFALKIKEKAQSDFDNLESFARKKYGKQSIKAWDVAYYTEKLRKESYDISEKELMPYFLLDNVLNGLFTIANKLYGIEIKEESGFGVWEQSVRFYSIHDEDNNLLGGFYLDLFTRDNKRGGAWMDPVVSRKSNGDSIRPAIAQVVTNFSPSVEGKPCLLTHDEVNTLFHEFGHAFHHILTKINEPSIGGAFVAWDFVELPSQFFENWCIEKDALFIFAKHYETGEPIPEDLYNKFYRARNFQAAMAYVRQLEFALFDFMLHNFTEKYGQKIRHLLENIRKEVSVVPSVDYNRFENGFSHIFSGGYAAGYYSYLWSEVLAADAFDRFAKEGIFNRQTGNDFKKIILEQGSIEDEARLFELFRGRKQDVNSLLEQRELI